MHRQYVSEIYLIIVTPNQVCFAFMSLNVHSKILNVIGEAYTFIRPRVKLYTE